jgi:hypothetical protein
MWSSLQGSILYVLLRDPLERIFSFFLSLSAIPRELIQHSDFWIAVRGGPMPLHPVVFCASSSARQSNHTRTAWSLVFSLLSHSKSNFSLKTPPVVKRVTYIQRAFRLPCPIGLGIIRIYIGEINKKGLEDVVKTFMLASLKA